MAKIKIVINDDDFDAKELKFNLEHKFNDFFLNERKEYLLKLQLKKEISSAAIRKNSEVTRYTIKSIVHFELSYLNSNKFIDKGVITITSGHDTTSSEYADYIAENYSVKNNIREICEELQSRIGIILLNIANENK